MAASTWTRNVTSTSDNETANQTTFQEEEDVYFHENTMVGIVPLVLYLSTIYAVVILGLIGNILEFVLMQHAWFRLMSYSVYLRFLAVCDSLVLLVTSIEDILDHQYKMRDTIFGFCVLVRYLISVSRFVSSWLIVFLTLDRFVAVGFPLKRAMFCSMKTSLALSLGLTVATMVESAVLVAHVKETGEGDELYCEEQGTPAFFNYLAVRTALLDLESFMPCFLILVFNIFTILAIRRGQKFRQTFTERGKENTRPGVDRVSLSLIAVSLMAFFTLVPEAILEGLEMLWSLEYETAQEVTVSKNATIEGMPDNLDQAGEVWPLLNLIRLVNYAQNFYIMVVSGPRYRVTLIVKNELVTPNFKFAVTLRNRKHKNLLHLLEQAANEDGKFKYEVTHDETTGDILKSINDVCGDQGKNLRWKIHSRDEELSEDLSSYVPSHSEEVVFEITKAA